MKKGKSVLIVDAHRGDREHLARILTEQHMLVVEADSVDVAIVEIHSRTLAGAPAQFAVIFVNRYLPLGTGVDLVAEIRVRSQIAELPVVMTDDEAISDKTKALLCPLGLAALIGKPLSKSVVAASLRRVFRR